MRSEWERDQDSRADEPEEEPAPQEDVQLNPAALAITLVGVAMIVVGLFLPANENSGFSNIERNSLIQQGLVVWTVVIFGSTFVIGLVRSYQQRKQISWWSLLFPVTAGASTARLLKGTTMYPVVNGSPDASAAGFHAAAGTGVYVIVAGAVICGLGVLGLRLSPGQNVRRCPDCAETVLAEARVCKHCGRRLDTQLASE